MRITVLGGRSHEFEPNRVWYTTASAKMRGRCVRHESAPGKSKTFCGVSTARLSTLPPRRECALVACPQCQEHAAKIR